MKKICFNLFRIKIIKPNQFDIFQLDIDKKSSADIFLEILREQPSAEFRRNYEWKQGKVHQIGEDKFHGFFKFGKISIGEIDTFDNEENEFQTVKYNSGDHSIVVFNGAIGLLAIGINYALGNARSTANKLGIVLSNSKLVKEANLRVIVSEIKDPKDFIEKIRMANAIKQFKASFTGPNPIDPDEYFQKPFARLAQVTNAATGTTTLNGANLDYESVEVIARSTAATGNEASARIQKNKSDRLETVHFKGDPIKLSYKEKDFSVPKVLKDMSEKYKTLRGA